MQLGTKMINTVSYLCIWFNKPQTLNVFFFQVYIKGTGEKGAELVTDQGAIYVTSNGGYNWKAAIQETVSATLNR